MNNPITNWWRSQQFKFAVQRGDTGRAIELLKAIQKSGAKFSWLEKLFRDKLQLERSALDYKREVVNIRKQITEISQESKKLLSPNQNFINYISQSFKFLQHDEYNLQVTGIEQKIFDELEYKLFEYLQEEFSKVSQDKLMNNLATAWQDINNLKIGKDPDYRFNLTPHVYFIKYFLENVYCVYLAWFLIYQNGLLPAKLNILDIAAGPGTVAYSLSLFLMSMNDFVDITQMHISYFSLEKQDAFQYRGLQFWRKYIESRLTPVNAYFRFVTSDIFNWNAESTNIPKNFFDFIFISHCFFSDPVKRQEANNIYQQIFTESISHKGYVILIIQDKKLLKAYGVNKILNQEQQRNIVNKFINEMGLELIDFRYFRSTNPHQVLSSREFAKFADENLPKQQHIHFFNQQYFNQKYPSHYTLDDYVILARKLS
ncbi:MAG TPA: photosystem II assembly protein [Nostocaceae cyanobacterium]|nr:photosystem II assembly protein [Nostocaceae cyanobacterium]